MKFFQIKISIKQSKPPIWRRCLIPAGITFDQLKDILIEVMGWGGFHLTSFEVPDEKLIIENRYENEDSFVPYDYNWKDAQITKIDSYMKVGKWFTFTYDFGDDWEHRVEIEDVVIDDTLTSPKVLKYKGDCPPEDCGGIYGYYDILETLKDKNNPEYKEMSEWFKAGFSEYDIEDVNDYLEDAFNVEVRDDGKIYVNDELGYKSIIDDSGLSLKELLGCYTKFELELIGNMYGLKLKKKATKDDYINTLHDLMLEPQSLKSALLMLKSEEFDLYDKLARNSYLENLSNEEQKNLGRMFSFGYLGIRDNHVFDIPDDVRDLYFEVADDDFRDVEKQIAWFIDCLSAASVIYGVIDLSTLTKLFNRNRDYNLKAGDVEAIADELPSIYNDMIRKDEYFIEKSLIEDDMYKKLLEIQKNIPYYIPTIFEIKALADGTFFGKGIQSNKLIDALKKIEKFDNDDIHKAVMELHFAISQGCTMEDTLDILEDNNIIIEENYFEEITDLLTDLWNSTRMLVYRGNTSNAMNYN